MTDRTDLWNEWIVIGSRVDQLRDVVQNPFPSSDEAYKAAEETWQKTTEIRNMLAAWAMNVKLAALRGELEK